MPTGYTAAVADGSITSLREFALQCARGMGALVMMRDQPWDAPIPERFEPSTYNANRLAEVQDELAKLRAMRPQEWQAAADADYEGKVKSAADYAAGKQVQRDRYNAMIAKVEAWQGAPEGIKDFMLDQLRESVRFDCAPGYSEDIQHKSGEEWKVDREAVLMKDAAYHAEAQHKEIDRTNGRNAWVVLLRSSLEGVL